MKKRILYLILMLHLNVFVVYGEEANDLKTAIKNLSSDNYEIRLNAKKELESAGLRAIPLLRKMTNSDDLETKEFVEKIISSSFSYKNDNFKVENYISIDSKSTIRQIYIDGFNLILNDLFVNTFDKQTIKNPIWDIQLKKLIQLCISYLKNIEAENELTDPYHLDRSARINEMEIRIAINELNALEYNNPLFLYLKCSMYFHWKDFRCNSTEISKTMEAISKSSFSNYFKYQLLFFTKYLKVPIFYEIKSKEANSLALPLFEQWVEFGKESILKNKFWQRKYIQMTENFWDELTFEQIESKLDNISENTGKNGWIDNVIRSQFYIKKGYFLRGNDFATLANDDNAEKLFQLNLIEAEKKALTACAISPDLPEPFINMVTISMGKPTPDRIRLWFEKAVKLEPDNSNTYSKYIWALYRRFGGSEDEMLSLGKEYLAINNSKTNTAKFYMNSINKIRDDYDQRINAPNPLIDIEWAVEQQVSFKTKYSYLFYTDVAIAAFNAKDYQKTFDAIQKTKGLFSYGWYRLDIGSGFVERFVTQVDKYKNKPLGKSLNALEIGKNEKNVEHIKKILSQLENDFLPIDKPNIINILYTFNKIEIPEIEELFSDLTFKYGYQEAGLARYIYFFSTISKNSMKLKFIERYGSKTMEAADLIINYIPKEVNNINELKEKLKVIFLSDGKTDADLDKDDEYNKTLLRCLFYLGLKDEKSLNLNYYQLILPITKKLIKTGSANDFLTTHIFLLKNQNISYTIADVCKNRSLTVMDENIASTEQEIIRLSNITDNQKLIEEVRKTWFIKGNFVMVLEMANLLASRKLEAEAEMLRTWAFHSLEVYGQSTRAEKALETYGICPGYDKEACRRGVIDMTHASFNAPSYLMAYHLFKLEQFHLAYEVLCKGQMLRKHPYSIILNRKKFETPDELLKFVINDMLASKNLPDYIRFNLKDQFDEKFKK